MVILKELGKSQNIFLKIPKIVYTNVISFCGTCTFIERLTIISCIGTQFAEKWPKHAFCNRSQCYIQTVVFSIFRFMIYIWF